MNQDITFKIWHLLAAILIPTIGFIVTDAIQGAALGRDVENNKAAIEEKVDNDVLIQYMKLIEERYELQKRAFESNEEEHKEILKKLEAVQHKIHELEVKKIGYMQFRSGNRERWFDLEDAVVFMMENKVMKWQNEIQN